ncbi:MAG: hypothetical protein QOC76_5037 [Mycobacterium sp.]|jgi:hypothetical protein|nr:hypothetical protein [Mycobacterium sp.]
MRASESKSWGARILVRGNPCTRVYRPWINVRLRGVRAWIAVATLLLVGCNLPSAPVGGPTTPLATAPLPPPPPPATTIDHDGSYKVGRDIAVGTWHTDGPLRRVNQYDENGNPILVPTCHWATGGIGEQNGAPTVYGQASNVKTGDESGPRDITISPSDNDFTTIGCKPWQLRP